MKSKHAQLLYEAKVYKLLAGGGSSSVFDCRYRSNVDPCVVGIPRVLWSGKQGDYNIMVMELLGPSLEDLFNECGRTFSVKTVLMLADQMLSRTELLHSRNFIHRDIKPDNFLMGLGSDAAQVFMIDFGLSKRFCDLYTLQHIPYRDKKSLTGTARYASINTHGGIEQSRRDDLESLCYIWLYFLKGSLPWQGLKGTTKQQKYTKISEKKLETSIEELCGGCEPEFAGFLRYTRSLAFDEKPDYAYLSNLLRGLFHRKGYQYDNIYDWSLKLKTGSSSFSNSMVCAHDSFRSSNVSEGV